MLNLVIIKNTQCITPPPGIAQTLAQNSRDNLQKFGHVTNQLRKAVKVVFYLFIRYIFHSLGDFRSFQCFAFILSDIEEL